MADSDPLTELLNPAVRVASKPSNACGNHRVSLLGQTRGAEEGLKPTLLNREQTKIAPCFDPSLIDKHNIDTGVR